MKRVIVLIMTATLLLTGALPGYANPASITTDDILDLDQSWAAPYMEKLVDMGVVNGYPVATDDETPVYELRPEQKITRAEFAVMLARALNLVPNAQALTVGDSATIPDWAKGEVGVLAAKGVVQGNGGAENNFRPSSFITRAEIAAMITRAVDDQKEVTAENPFVDVHNSDWFFTPVLKAKDMGIVNGRTADKFVPGGDATRAEVMTMLVRFLTNDAANPPADETLTKVVTDYYQQVAASLPQGDMEALQPYVTGVEEYNLALLSSVLQDPTRGGEYSLQVTTLEAPVVLAKSDHLAEVTYKVQKEEHYTITGHTSMDKYSSLDKLYLQKIGDQWKVYTSETLEAEPLP